MIKKFPKFFSSVRMQLVASVFAAIAPVLVLTYLVNQTWFWDYAPGWARDYFVNVPWVSLTVGLLALAAAWFGGEHFILRQVRVLSEAAKRLGTGDLGSRTGLRNSPGELGQLAETFDSMAGRLQQRVREREEAENVLLLRALQQTVVAALGQFALTNNDLEALISQAVIQVGETLEVQYCGFFELMPDGRLLLRAGAGWKSGSLDKATLFGDNRSQAGFTLRSGEPVVVIDLPTDTRFKPSAFLIAHEIVSGVTITIPTRAGPFGVFCVYTTKPRKFTTDEVQFLLATVTAIGMAVQRKRGDAELQKLAAFAQLNPNPALEFAADGTITYFNDAAFKLASSIRKNHPRDLLPPDIGEIIHHCLSTGHSKLRLETTLEGCTFSWSFHPMLPSSVVHCYIEDTTARLSLEAQLRQSQKMESVGQLAAGVAHDFNNMLTIIQGHASSLLARPGLPREVSEPVQTVYYAAERAAGLTRQLLMFSRKNVIQSRPLDLREIVGNMGKMLHRLIGENIALQFHPPAELPIVSGDSGMMEQVLMNLSVNARDAMPHGGTLTIGVETVLIDDHYLEAHPEAHFGKFVRLRVGDTGTGMDAMTLAHIFEPFFTTKEVGKGTLFGGNGGMRLASWPRTTESLGLKPFWRLAIGNYVLLGVASPLIALPANQSDTLPEEWPAWLKLRAAHLAEIRAAFDALKPEQRVILFCHDPTALPFLWREESVRRRLPQIEQTIIGHLHTRLVLWKSRLLSGIPPVRFLGNSVRKFTSALNEAHHWWPFKVRLCPALSGIELLNDGGYYTVELDPQAKTPAQFTFHPLPRLRG